MKIVPARTLSIAMTLVGATTLLGHTGCGDQTAPVDPPPVPTGVYTVTGDGWVDVYWEPVRSADLEGYGIYRSNQADGQYQRIGTNRGVESTSFRDEGVTNGITYFYAVDSFNFAGQESALSFEDAFDTPRPAGTGVTVLAKEVDATRSGIDFSSYDTPGFVRPFNDPDTDIVVQRIGGVLFAKGTVIANVPNDIQDLGWTASFDEIGWAPGEGWSVAPNGVELIAGHTYVVWTWNEYFAKFRVTNVTTDAGQNPTGVIIDWAYQIDPGNPELRPQLAREQEPVSEREDS